MFHPSLKRHLASAAVVWVATLDHCHISSTQCNCHVILRLTRTLKCSTAVNLGGKSTETRIAGGGILGD